MELLCVFVNFLLQFCTCFGNSFDAAPFKSPKIQCASLMMFSICQKSVQEKIKRNSSHSHFIS